MPIYEYKCHQCGEKFEVRRRITERAFEDHAGCGGEVEQLISAPALHFKGTGWYVTTTQERQISVGFRVERQLGFEKRKRKRKQEQERVQGRHQIGKQDGEQVRAQHSVGEKLKAQCQQPRAVSY